MVGITGFGAYIPFARMGEGTAGWNGRIEKAIAGWDEDSITMATAAVIDCIKGADRHGVDGLYLATTTLPYLEKQNAAIVAVASDLKPELITADFAGSLRSGTTALRAALDAVKAGSARQVVVAAADVRVTQARSEFEPAIGDGAAALAIGSENVIAMVEASYSLSQEILDTWRAADDQWLRSSEDRFGTEKGYLTILPQAVKALLAQTGLKQHEFSKAVFYAPDAKKHKEMASLLGFEPKTQVQDLLFHKVGNTGASFALLMLVAALEEAKAGDRLLFAGYGDGADVFILKVTDEISKLPSRGSIKGQLASKKIIPDYLTYARWRGLIDIAQPVKRPPLDAPSPAAMFREQEQNLRLYGVKCTQCGTNQYPKQRVCTKCHSKDEFESVRFAEQKATLFTYSLDYLGPTMDPPLPICFIDFAGGGRMMCMMTDAVVNEIQVGMPLEMTFRRLHTVGGIHNYYWKCQPAR